MYRFLSLVVIAVSVIGCSKGPDPAEDQPAAADLVITNGNVYTVDDDNPTAEAVVVSGNMIVFVGDTAGAIRAYEHYLTLRTRPDPPLQPQLDSVRAEYEALTGKAWQHD